MRSVLVLSVLECITCHPLRSIHGDEFDRLNNTIDHLRRRRMSEVEEGLKHDQVKQNSRDVPHVRYQNIHLRYSHESRLS